MQASLTGAGFASLGGCPSLIVILIIYLHYDDDDDEDDDDDDHYDFERSKL